MTEDRTALIALGSNLGDSATIINAAFVRLQQLSVKPIRKSSLWRTVPVDCPPGSPVFINAACALIPSREENPESLLSKLLQMEREFGRRTKTVLNEPRPLDLDLIAFDGEVRDTPELTLPHPRAHLRRFVLQPLGEITPDFTLPGQKQTVLQLLAALPSGENVSPI